MSDRTEKQRPSFTAYQVKTDRDDKSHFTKVGAALPHKDGKGHTVTLDAMPVDSKIVLRSAKDRLNAPKQDRPPKSQDQGRD